MILSALAVSLALSADPAPRFDRRSLLVEGDVLEVVAADLDGDGKQDLLAPFVSGVPPHEKRSFAIFWNQGRSFSGKPDLVLPVDEETTCAFDVADVDGKPGAELLLVTPRGVEARSFRDRKATEPAVLVTEPTLFPRPAEGELPRLHAVQDLAGEGSADLLLPSAGGLAVFRHGEKGYERTGKVLVALRVDTRGFGRRRSAVGKHGGLSAVRIVEQLPAVHLVDADGDGKRDLVVTLEDRVAVFKQRPGVVFPEKPDLARDFQVRTPEELKEANTSAAVSANDIDGDGVADLIVRKQVTRGIASAATTSFVFFGKKGGGWPEKADQVIKSEGASGSEVELIDITGDGHPDLVVPSVNIGIWAIVKILTTKTLKVSLQVFPFGEGRRFSDRPAAERELKFRLALSGEADSQAVELLGDYDGDGRPDLAFGTDENELSIFRGLGGASLFAEDATEVVDVRAFGDIAPADLDGKGKSDLVLHYPSTKGHRGEIVVLLNKGTW